MGTLDILKEYRPFSMVPPGALPENSPMTQQDMRPAFPYNESPNPTHLAFYPPFGPFAKAGIYEVNGFEFLAGFQPYHRSNTQVVTAPERPVDFGTYEAVAARGGTALDYNQPPRGTSLQPRVITNSHAVAGNAPNQGIYTGFGGGGGFTNLIRYGDEG